MQQKTISFPVPTTVNMRDHALFSPTHARDMRNYYPVGKGRLSSAPGSLVRYRLPGGSPSIHAVTSFQEGMEVLGYGDTLAVYDTRTDTLLPLRSVASDAQYALVPYGDFVFACNGGSRVMCVSLRLTLSAVTTAFAVGDKVVGAASGATAEVLVVSGAELTLGTLVGRFAAGEAVTAVTGSGSGTVGTCLPVYTELPAAPHARVLGIAGGNRLLCGNTELGLGSIAGSAVDTGVGIPFSGATSFTPGQNMLDAFALTFRGGGKVVAFGAVGSQSVVLFDHGKMGFRIGTLSSSTEGLLLDTPIDFQAVDFGASSRARVTPHGIAYANRFGLWLLTSSHMSAIASGYGARENRLTELLGHDVIEYFHFDTSDVAYDTVRDLMLVSARSRNAEVNDVIIVVNVGREFPGVYIWDKGVAAFYEHDSVIDFAASDEAVMYRLDFFTATDDVYDVKTALSFELGDGKTLSRLLSVALHGEWHPGSSVTLSFDYQDRRGIWRVLPRRLTLTSPLKTGMLEGGGAAPAREAAVRGKDDMTHLIDAYFRARYVTPDFLRLRVTLSCHDGYRHILNSFTFGVQPRGAPQTESAS